MGSCPKAADTLGVNVYRYRYMNVMLGGAIAGFGGAFFIQGSVGRFDENMTAGARIHRAGGNDLRTVASGGGTLPALIFGFAESLAGKLAILQVPIPSEFLPHGALYRHDHRGRRVVGRARPRRQTGSRTSRSSRLRRLLLSLQSSSSSVLIG